MFNWLVALLLFNAFDAIFTVDAFFVKGAAELNPLMDQLLSYGVVQFLTVKIIIITTVVVALIGKIWESAPTRNAFKLTTFAYGILFTWHIINY